MNSSNDDHEIDASKIDERHHDANVDEVLVAYLDGQLAAEESERIESQLSSDPVVRQRMQELDRVWNALDVLPRSTASPAFTRSTVEMAAVSASRAKPLEGGGRARKRLPAGAIASLLGLVFGAAMTYVIAGTPERRALRDLPTAIHASALENAGSIDFLLQLTAQADKELKPFLTDEIRAEAQEWGEVSAMTLAERRQWLTALPAEELTEVNTAVDRFQDRSPLQQESLRALSIDLSEEEQAESLLQAAVVYQSIVSQLPSSEQATLRQMEAEGRLRLVRKNAGRLAREAVLRLNGQQRADLRAAIEKLVRSEAFKREADELTERLPPGRKDRRREEIARRQPQLILLTTTRFVARPRRGQEFGGRRGDRLPPELRARMQEGIERFETDIAEPITAAWSGWADRLQDALPEATQRALNEAAVKGEAERARLFERLLLEAAPEDLSDTFSDLPESEIERLLLMPRDRFVEELSEQEAAGLNFETRPPRERDFGRAPGRSGEDRRGGRGSGEFGERPFGEGPPPRREPPPLGREG